MHRVAGPASETRCGSDCLRRFMVETLTKVGCDRTAAESVSNGLVETSLRGVDSHGVRLFPHYVRALVAGRINGFPEYQIEQGLPSVAVMDGDHAFGHASGVAAMHHAVSLAKQTGIGAVAVNHSSHFGAAACYGLIPPSVDMIGLCFTHASPLLVPERGKRAFFGANPICFTAPMLSEPPFCLDMSVTQMTWNGVKLRRENGRPLPGPYAYDRHGQLTDDPLAAVALAGIGKYKGYGLSVMIDILCGLLTSMPVGDQVSNMYGNDIAEKRNLGQFYMALRIDGFVPVDEFKERLQTLAESVRSEPPAEPEHPVLFPGDPEKHAWRTRSSRGIPMADALMREFLLLSEQHGVPFGPHAAPACADEDSVV